MEERKREKIKISVKERKKKERERECERKREKQFNVLSIQWIPCFLKYLQQYYSILLLKKRNLVREVFQIQCLINLNIT